MRQTTIMAEIGKALRGEGLDAGSANQMFELFQHALESATGANGHDGLGGYVPMNDGDALAAVEENALPILTASAIAFAGAEIADAIRGGLSEVAQAIEAAQDPTG